MTDHSAVDRVRRELARLDDPDTASEVPPHVTDRIAAALISAPGPTRPSRGRRVLGLVALVVGASIATVAARRRTNGVRRSAGTG